MVFGRLLPPQSLSFSATRTEFTTFQIWSTLLKKLIYSNLFSVIYLHGNIYIIEISVSLKQINRGLNSFNVKYNNSILSIDSLGFTPFLYRELIK